MEAKIISRADFPIERLISGGQTGVDRAALDLALAIGLPCGGWCPRGRKAEDGRIPGRYPLDETDSPRYDQRTEWNVRDSDGTLVLTAGPPTGGTALTIALARKWRKPCLVIDLQSAPAPEPLIRWCEQHTIRVLNVAGPRESASPGISRRAGDFLRAFLEAARRRGTNDVA